jgi:hypothetical protein
VRVTLSERPEHVGDVGQPDRRTAALSAYSVTPGARGAREMHCAQPQDVVQQPTRLLKTTEMPKSRHALIAIVVLPHDPRGVANGPGIEY